MATISMDYENVCNEVKRLRKIASDLNVLLNDVQSTFGDMNSYWEGAAASEFRAVNERWRMDTKVIENEVTALAALIQKVADEIREAELRAAEAIQATGGECSD